MQVKWIATWTLIFGMTIGSTTALADRVAREATLAILTGQAEWLPSGSATWEAAKVNQRLTSGDKIRTGPDGEVTLNLDDGSSVVVSPDSEFSIASLTKESANEQIETILAVLKGRVRAQVTPLQTGSTFEIETPAMVAAVRGTTLSVGINPDGTISASSEDGNVDLVREGENNFVAKLESGEEALVEFDPATNTIKVTCVKGVIELTGPDGVKRVLNPGDTIVFSGGAATFIPAAAPAGDAPIGEAIGEAVSAS